MSTTANKIQVWRGLRLIADGVTARVDGVPLGDVELPCDIAEIIGANLEIAGLDNKSRRFRVPIIRQHGDEVMAGLHAMLAPQLACVVDDFSIWFDTGEHVHKMTSEDAAWQRATVDSIDGHETRITYEIECNHLVRTLDDVPVVDPDEEAA